MKMEEVQPEEGRFTFNDADNFVKFGEENGLTMTGHVLIGTRNAPTGSAWTKTEKTFLPRY